MIHAKVYMKTNLLLPTDKQKRTPFFLEVDIHPKVEILYLLGWSTSLQEKKTDPAMSPSSKLTTDTCPPSVQSSKIFAFLDGVKDCGRQVP